MADITRRTASQAGAAATLAASAAGPAVAARPAPDVVVVGAGVFGAWTARALQRLGRQVLLVDAWGPGHARSSSGGESRLIRGSYGADSIYAGFAWHSLAEWKALSARADLPLFHPCGVLFFFPADEDYVATTIEVHRRLSLTTRILEGAELRRRFPQIAFDDAEVGLFEPEFGALMARRSVATLVAEFVAAGGEYRQGAVAPPEEAGDALRHVTLEDGTRLSAEQFVFACGPWLPKLFPALLGRRLFATRQEVFFFATRPGDRSFGPDRFPGWVDFSDGDSFYGFPDLEGRGVKIASDMLGPPIDPDSDDRTPSQWPLEGARAYLERRFPALAGQPLSESRVCQYENSADRDFLIDFHPGMANVLLVGAGSGHGFKHGPAVGRYAAERLTDAMPDPEPRFSLASKGEPQDGASH